MNDSSGLNILTTCCSGLLLPLIVGIILLVIEHKSGFFSKNIQNIGGRELPPINPSEKITGVIGNVLEKGGNDDSVWENLAQNKARLAVARHFGISDERVKLGSWEVVDGSYGSMDTSISDFEMYFLGTIFFNLVTSVIQILGERNRYHLSATYNILDKRKKKYINGIRVDFDRRGNPKGFPPVYLPPEELEK